MKAHEIRRQVTNHFEVDITHQSRACRYARPRQIGMYLCRKFTPLSLTQIARVFGLEDHATVLHGVRRVEVLMKENPSVFEDVITLEQKLNAGY